MCLAAVAIGAHKRFPLVIAANRDEWFNRPTQPLDWWQGDSSGPHILGGRDLQAGGTWLGLSGTGRLALLTNVREPGVKDEDAPSRGAIVPRWLSGDHAIDKFWMRTALEGYGGFNLITASLGGEVTGPDWHWASNRAILSRRLLPGIYAMSNAELDTPWPKVRNLKQCLQDTLRNLPAGAGADDDMPRTLLADSLLHALQDDEPVPDHALPATGVPLDWERWLSPAFIRTPDGRYGTRSSMLVITERRAGRLLTHVLEHSYAPDTGPHQSVLRETVLPDWPGAQAQPGIIATRNIGGT